MQIRSLRDHNAIVIGSGTLGQELATVLRKADAAVDVVRRSDGLDVRHMDGVLDVLRLLRSPDRPTYCFNATGYTNVDGAETDLSGAISTNVGGTHNIAAACDALKITAVHFSSDAVFLDATGQSECVEPVEEPAGIYGASKLLGERAVRGFHNQYVLRTANLYGRHGKNWASRLQSELRGNRPVVADAYRTVAPTWARWVAEVAVALPRLAPPGTYHVCATDTCGWDEFALTMAQQVGVRVGIEPTQQLHRPLGRSGYLTSMLLPAYGIEIPSWQDLLLRYLSEDPA